MFRGPFDLLPEGGHCRPDVKLSTQTKLVDIQVESAESGFDCDQDFGVCQSYF